MKRPETKWFIRHPSEKCLVQLLTQGTVTVDDVLFDCTAIFGADKPTTVSLGTPENVVWPTTVAHGVDL